MSRSNPNARLVNPSTRWVEWNGSTGELSYYDKTEKKDIAIPIGFVFILLDELATVRGWHDPSGSGIYANEVRDTVKDALSVKSFKGGPIAEGLYQTIKDKVKAQGGGFAANLYMAYKDATGALQIGCLQLTGAALNAWIEFRGLVKNEVFDKAIAVIGSVDGQKGAIKYKSPAFALKLIDPATNAKALELDKALQAYLEAYLVKTPVTQQVANIVEQAQPKVEEKKEEPKQDEKRAEPVFTPTDDLPF